MKKRIPYFLLAILFVIALVVKHYRARQLEEINSPSVQNAPQKNGTAENKQNNLDVFRDAEAKYFFTKHARCRMACRKITQQEIKEIVRKADVNYNKSELDAERGPKYALEGYTLKYRQHIRVIVAPTQKHLSIVTVIDLDEDWACPSCQ
jgi:hypothetical protein